jgi:hypothetical protein
VKRIVVVSVLMIVSACSGGGNGRDASEASSATVSESDRSGVAMALAANVITPGYGALAAAADKLTVEVTSLCDALGDPGVLERARSAWKESAATWSRTRAFRFGPAMELRSMSKIDFPVDRAKVAALLAGTSPLDSNSVASLGADQRGLSGIEVVLFDAGNLGERSCSFAKTAATLVAHAAHAVHDAWVAKPAIETKSFIDSSVNAMVFALADLADARLGKASGDITGTPEYAEIDNGPAEYALQEMVAIVDSVEVMRSGGDDGVGIASLLARQGGEAGSRLASELVRATSAIKTIPAPLAATTDTAPVSAAYEAVRVALVTVRTQVASLLGVTLTLGDADGDS